MDCGHRTTWDLYTASWNAESTEQKHTLFDRCLAKTCVYADPLVRADGWQALEACMLDLQRQLPGAHFVTTRFMSHRQTSIAVWTMMNGAGEPVGDGISHGEYDASGKLVTMTGFFAVPTDSQ